MHTKEESLVDISLVPRPPFNPPRGKGGLVNISLVPRPPFNLPRGKGGLVNIVQNFCTFEEFQHGLVWQLSVLGFLTANQCVTPIKAHSLGKITELLLRFIVTGQ